MVYAPYAVLHHYESKSRGLEDTPEKVATFQPRDGHLREALAGYLKERRSVLQPEPDTAENQILLCGPEKGEDRGTI